MQPSHNTRRQHFRHPAEIPIEISSSTSVEKSTEYTHDISCDGLSFQSASALQVDHIVTLTIKLTKPRFEESARVIWCHELTTGYEIGVSFLEKDALFRIRMVEQVCHIEQYRKDVLKLQNRDLTSQEAALEWINKYATDFSR
ncbi:MAG TPA: PilZ domain-containing protein [Gammaproteobacteria bacterium]|nr:PilZ domain-containing protein [Gammaproteobacteria bacterium]